MKSIEDGEIQFAVDQQQYLQGYLPVVFLALNKRNLNTVGGGQPVLTGPGFVDQGQRGDGGQAGAGRHPLGNEAKPPGPRPGGSADLI